MQGGWLWCAMRHALLSCCLLSLTCGVLAWDNLDLPAHHIPYYVKRNPNLRKQCLKDPKCPYKAALKEPACYGYESDCKFSDSVAKQTIECTGKSKWPNVKTVDDHVDVFWKQGDFGYLKERLKDYINICTSNSESKGGSVLKCGDNLRYCAAKNIYFNFRHLQLDKNNKMYREDVLQKKGDVGGRCTATFYESTLKSRLQHMSYLQSWGQELQHFENNDQFRMNSQFCDVIIDKPTVLIKLDAAVSMYHHFCDFVNLYAAQHLNGSFDRDINILLWDTTRGGYRDLFDVVWSVFTNRPLLHLKDYDGKKVCFRNAILPLLARQRLGLYFNMPVVDNCHGSAFFRMFSEHVLHRLGLKQHGPLEKKIRLKILSRSTKFRKILNVQELVTALKKIPELDPQIVDYTFQMSFKDQLQSTMDTDIFIGMHGSGLTHFMFLPKWAAAFEIYNCGDPGCYSDLARLSGVKYWTWSDQTKVYPEDEGKHPQTGEPHQKFTNYKFDVKEFVRIVKEMVDHVKNHPEFIKSRAAKTKTEKIEL